MCVLQGDAAVLFTPYYFSHRAALEFAGVEARSLLPRAVSEQKRRRTPAALLEHPSQIGALWGGSGTVDTPRAPRGRAGDAGALAGSR